MGEGMEGDNGVASERVRGHESQYHEQIVEQTFIRALRPPVSLSVGLSAFVSPGRLSWSSVHTRSMHTCGK